MANLPKIESIELIERNDTDVKVRITFEETTEINCCGGQGIENIAIEYALHDVYYNLLQDFTLIPSLPKPLKKTDVYTIPIPLVSTQCKIHISGLVLSGGFAGTSSFGGRIGVLDYASELLEPGDYPDAKLAIPNSIEYSLDSIAIPPGRRIIYYRNKNFTGEVVLDQEGPALIWNRLWNIQDPNDMYLDDYYPYFNNDFTDPVLQSIYPQSRRFWSNSLMWEGLAMSDSGWSNGSFKIIKTGDCIEKEPCQIALRLVCTDDDAILFDNNSWKVPPFANNIPSSLISLLDEAANEWKNIIKFDDDVVKSIREIIPSWNGITISLYEKADYGPGPIAACSVSSTVSLGGNKYNALSFNLYINSYYWDNPQNVNFSWRQVLIHELGHALGVGTLWDTLDNIWLSGTSYPLSQSSYNSVSNVNRLKIPLEDIGGGGTAGAHWEDSDRSSDGQLYPGIIDIMQGTINNYPIGPITIGFLKDLGYANTTLSGNYIMTNSNNNNVGLTPATRIVNTDQNLLQTQTETQHQPDSPRCGCGCHEHFPVIQPKITLEYNPITQKTKKV